MEIKISSIHIFILFSFHFLFEMLGMTPTPEKKKMPSNRKWSPHNVERTVAKYGHAIGKGTIDISESDTDNDTDENEENEDDDENENDDEIGILNISNHNINDFDEVLQSEIIYATPNEKNKICDKTIKNYKSKEISYLQSPKRFTPIKSPGFSTQNKIRNKLITKSPLPSHRSYINEKSNKTEIKMKSIQNNRIDINDKIKKNKIKLDEKFIESVAEKDLNDICMQIKMLNEELKYYEEITGKRSIFQREVRYYIML